MWFSEILTQGTARGVYFTMPPTLVLRKGGPTCVVALHWHVWSMHRLAKWVREDHERAL